MLRKSSLVLNCFPVILIFSIIFSACSYHNITTSLTGFKGPIYILDSSIISSSDLINLINSKSNKVNIVDIREIDDFNKGHIPGAINIPKANNIKESIAVDDIIVIYCYTGKSASQVCDSLRKEGYMIASLEGGWLNGWLPYINSVPLDGC